MAHELTLRKALATDSKLLFEWANDPLVRQNAFRQASISWEEHQVWLANKLDSPNSKIFIVFFEEKPVGTVRFDQNETYEWIITIAIDVLFRGKGISSQCILLGCEYLGNEFPGALVLAYIKIDNLASYKSFQKAGFEPVGNCIVSDTNCFLLKRYI